MYKDCKAYQAIESTIKDALKNIKNNHGLQISITDESYASLVRTVVEVFHTHPQGEYVGDDANNLKKLDTEYSKTSLIAHEHQVQDYSKVIDAIITNLSKNGGGTVIIPKGDYYTGAIELKSNITLFLDVGATLHFIKNRTNEFYPLRHTRFEGIEVINFSPLIYAHDAQNIAIEGSGTLDGGASLFDWMPLKYGLFNEPNQEALRQRIFKMAEDKVSLFERTFDDSVSTLRPSFISPYQCKNFVVTGVIIKNSPFWLLHPILTDNIHVLEVTFESPYFNNDGCDPESCKNVLIEKCFFKTGDDCIAIKSGRNQDGASFNVKSENFIVRDNHFEDGHGGITIGSEISGGFKTLYAHDNVFDSTKLDYPIRFKTNAMRGGDISDVYIENCKIASMKKAMVQADFTYEEGERGPRMPHLHDVCIKDIDANLKDGSSFLFIKGYANNKINNFSFKNIKLIGSIANDVCENTANFSYEKVTLNGNELSFVD